MKPIRVKLKISVNELKNYLNKNDYSAKRIEAVVLAIENKMRRKDIAQKLNVHRNRVAKWIRIFNEKGVEGLKSKKKGRRPIITEICKKSLEKALSQNPMSIGMPYHKWSAKAARFWITKNCGVNCGMPQAYKILKKLKNSGKK